MASPWTAWRGSSPAPVEEDTTGFITLVGEGRGFFGEPPISHQSTMASVVRGLLLNSFRMSMCWSRSGASNLDHAGGLAEAGLVVNNAG